METKTMVTPAKTPLRLFVLGGALSRAGIVTASRGVSGGYPWPSRPPISLCWTLLWPLKGRSQHFGVPKFVSKGRGLDLGLRQVETDARSERLEAHKSAAVPQGRCPLMVELLEIQRLMGSQSLPVL